MGNRNKSGSFVSRLFKGLGWLVYKLLNLATFGLLKRVTKFFSSKESPEAKDQPQSRVEAKNTEEESVLVDTNNKGQNLQNLQKHVEQKNNETQGEVAVEGTATGAEGTATTGNMFQKSIRRLMGGGASVQQGQRSQQPQAMAQNLSAGPKLKRTKRRFLLSSTKNVNSNPSTATDNDSSQPHQQ